MKNKRRRFITCTPDTREALEEIINRLELLEKIVGVNSSSTAVSGN